MQDIKIEGIGKIGAGEYGDVKIDGSGSCEGNLKCVVLKVDGALKAGGSIEAEALSIDGKLKAAGDIIAAEIDCDGMAKIEGGVRAKNNRFRRRLQCLTMSMRIELIVTV